MYLETGVRFFDFLCLLENLPLFTSFFLKIKISLTLRDKWLECHHQCHFVLSFLSVFLKTQAYSGKAK